MLICHHAPMTSYSHLLSFPVFTAKPISLKHLITHLHLFLMFWYHQLLLLATLICTFATIPQWRPISMYLVFPCLLLNQSLYEHSFIHSYSTQYHGDLPCISYWQPAIHAVEVKRNDISIEGNEPTLTSPSTSLYCMKTNLVPCLPIK